MANNENFAPKGNPVGKVFAPYFRARWQNFQNIITKADFYSKMPTEWLAYQSAYVRQWGEWSRGFVIGLHRGQFFATGMGKTVVDVLVRECMRGGYRFDSEDAAASAVITQWAEENDIENVIMNGFQFANALGNAILRLNLNADTMELYPTVHPVDSTYFQTNRKGKIVRAKFIDMLGSGTTKDTKYYTVEDRVWFNNAAWYRVSVYKYAGQVSNAAFTETTAIKDVDPWAQSLLNDVYGDIKLCRWYKLPFKSLGCYNWKNTATSLAISEMTGYADSSLHTALDILYAIDYNYSMGQLDQYFGRTRVIIPKAMQVQSQRVIHNGLDYGDMERFVEQAPLQDDVFTEIPANGFISDKPAEPKFVQPDLRGLPRKQLNDHYLELLASKVGLSSSTLANHLTYNQSKTATEVTTEKDTTDVTVAHKRDLANAAIDAMLCDVCDFFGIDFDVDITWNYSGNNNKEQILSEYQRGLMPLREAVKRLHPELTEAEVDKWVEDLKVAQPQGGEGGFDWNNSFGLGDEY